MKTKAVIAGAVLLAVLLPAILLTVHRSPQQAVTVRQVNSLHHGDGLTTIIFEVTNHTTDSYVLRPFEVQVRNGNVWTVPGAVDITFRPDVAPRGYTGFIINVTHLPGNCVARLSMHSEKKLLGFKGFVFRVRWNLSGRRISLNPYDKKSTVYGKPTKVFSEEWVETVK